MSIVLTLDANQQVLLTDLLIATDQEGRIPAGKALVFGAIVQQLMQPTDFDKMVAQIKAQAVQEMTQRPAPGAPGQAAQ